MNRWGRSSGYRRPEHDGVTRRIKVDEIKFERKPRSTDDMLASIKKHVQHRLEILEAKVQNEGSPDDEVVDEMVKLGRGLISIDRSSPQVAAGIPGPGQPGAQAPDPIAELTEDEITLRLRAK